MKNQGNILEEKENQLDIFIFLDPNTMRMKAMLSWGHIYMMMLSNIPQGKKNKWTNMNCIENEHIEEWNIQTLTI